MTSTHLTDTYDFSTEVFDGKIDDVTVSFHALLSTAEERPVQRFAVCHDFRVRVRGASNLGGEIRGNLENVTV